LGPHYCSQSGKDRIQVMDGLVRQREKSLSHLIDCGTHHYSRWGLRSFFSGYSALLLVFWIIKPKLSEESIMRKTILLLILMGLVMPLLAQEKEKERLESAAHVFEQIMSAPDKSIPQDLLDRCSCVAIIPSMLKGGFIVGGRYGRGAVVCRNSEKGPWGAPSMIILTGGSFGLQIGGAAVDVVMLVMGKDGVRTLLKNKFTVGGDASAAAGPVGRATTAETDAYMNAKILSYSRSKGLFAGLELKGAVVQQDDSGNQALYGKEMSARQILVEHTVTPPGSAKPLLAVLNKFSPGISKKPL
jgi:SH3 domain-containing YSC84-like protein 1